MPRTILIVDDDADDLTLFETALRAHGYEVATTTDAEEGLRMAKKMLPDMVILDEVMPKMFGSEIGQILADDPRTRHIPVLFLTSLKTPEDPSPASPANVVIAKSSGTEELIEAVGLYL